MVGRERACELARFQVAAASRGAGAKARPPKAVTLAAAAFERVMPADVVVDLSCLSRGGAGPTRHHRIPSIRGGEACGEAAIASAGRGDEGGPGRRSDRTGHAISGGNSFLVQSAPSMDSRSPSHQHNRSSISPLKLQKCVHGRRAQPADYHLVTSLSACGRHR